ncbi:MAG: leucyl aminopeptidase family protein [Bacteroidales bacterium]
MTTEIKITSQIKEKSNLAILASGVDVLQEGHLTREEIDYISKQHTDHKIDRFSFNRFSHQLFVYILKQEKEIHKSLEACRKFGDHLQQELNRQKLEEVTLTGFGTDTARLLAMAEGAGLANYQFIKYFKDKEDKQNSLKTLLIHGSDIRKEDAERLNVLLEAVCHARNMVNEPVMYMNAEKLSETITQMAADAGIKAEVFNKKKIESLKMGGLLAVNKGSIDPPTFTILEYKPGNAANEKPLILVGKGVVYDTGGLNLKTGSYMENMKQDMAGAAVMASTIYAIARSKLPLYVIALIPATDNRLNGNAYASGDVIRMYNGMTVEVINTDAEGRMILADALSYAKKYEPQLVIDAATLTGSAQRAIGKYGLAAMHAGAAEAMEKLKCAGDAVYERVVEFPFWDEYGELMKSDIADLKNTGPAEAGMITAGKFLEKFTDYPFIHLDIAGVAFNEKRDSYRNQGGTGFGVRLLYAFAERYLTERS